jgi:sodium/proline symporter
MNETPTGITVSADPWTVITFIVYLLFMVGIGIYSARFSSAGIGEFFIGGRKMRSFVVALSAVVSGRSAWLVVGVTGMAYVQGISAVWSIVGYTVVELLMFMYAAKRLREYTELYDAVTIPDYFASRFRDRSNMLRIASAVVIILFMVIYIAAQFDAGGKAFSSSFGFQHRTGVLLTAIIVLGYTLIGGFLAVSLTDVVQAVFMLVALLIVPVIAVADYGGIQHILQQAATIDAFTVDPMALGFGGLIGYLGIGLGSPGNPHILARYMSIRNPQQLRFSGIVATVWNVLMGWGAVVIGLAGRVYYPDAAMLPGSDTENLYPMIAQAHLHPAVYGVVLAAIIAAIMSTADSQLLVGASSCVRDVYQPLNTRGRKISTKRLVLISRTVIVVLVFLALALRESASGLVFWLVLFAWSGLGASFGPPLILSLFWARTSKWGVLAGLFSGTTVTIVWKQSTMLNSYMYELIPAFLISFLAVVVVSLVTKAPEEAGKELDYISSKYSRK